LRECEFKFFAHEYNLKEGLLGTLERSELDPIREDDRFKALALRVNRLEG